MPSSFYDNLKLNEDIELDLSMLEATGELLHDESKNHSTALQHASIGTPTWLQLASSTYGISMNPAYPLLDSNHYYDIAAADCLNLDFTSGDYSLALWVYWIPTSLSQVLMSKYVVSDCGWEAYLYDAGATHYLTVRHHHSAGASLRTASYSVGWPSAEWHLFSYSRIGTAAQHYRDGEPISTSISVGGLIDPESNAVQDFRFGCRYTENADWFKGRFHRPRAWSRALSAEEHKILYRLGYP